VEVKLHKFIFVLDRDDWPVSHSGHFIPEKKAPDTN